MSKRKIRKVLLSFEMVSIEKEEFGEDDERFKQMFEQDFELEIAYLKEIEEQRQAAAGAVESDVQVDVEKPVDPEVEELHKLLKPLHRAIVARLHPDINGPSTVQEFQEFQSAWDTGEFSIVISIAVRLGITDGLDDESMAALEARAAKMSQKISGGKKTARWFWGSSGRSDKNRESVVQSMGINKADFEAWKSKRTEDEKSIVRPNQLKLLPEGLS